MQNIIKKKIRIANRWGSGLNVVAGLNIYNLSPFNACVYTVRLILLKMSLYLVFRNKSGASRYFCIYVYTQRKGGRCGNVGTYTRYFKLRHGLYDAVFCAVLPKDLFNLFFGGWDASSHAVWLYVYMLERLPHHLTVVGVTFSIKFRFTYEKYIYFFLLKSQSKG